ncbi:ketimine reductase mu-crystallin-like isoform X3 [Xenia sp. Carnegie-2017]|uniref:ketimine reductase mu-crystallin-like isoform X3 n=1 Tax=Xenia sp. Carnegie-2017 TaxID=2897299 RepID=UPI001F034343|nr:ketimine reductase mu-crystallin-like isoform X3 [Xenia sp. Carnegie-2017]
MVLYISGEDVEKLLSYDDLIPIIEKCLVNFSKKDDNGIVMPVRSTVDNGNGYLFTMPCSSKNDEALSVKLVTLFPQQNPSIDSIIVLFNSTTGSIETLIDGKVATHMRTAAASAVALKHLTCLEKCKILCIIGAGAQARSHLNAFRHVCNFQEVRVWNRTTKNTENFAQETGAIPFYNAEQAVKNADVVVTATGSQTAVLCGDWLKPGAFVCSIGAPVETARELDDAVMLQSTVIVDSYAGAGTESGDIILSKVKMDAEIGIAVYDAITAKHIFLKYKEREKVN